MGNGKHLKSDGEFFFFSSTTVFPPSDNFLPPPPQRPRGKPVWLILFAYLGGIKMSVGIWVRKIDKSRGKVAPWALNLADKSFTRICSEEI